MNDKNGSEDICLRKISKSPLSYEINLALRKSHFHDKMGH